MCTGVRSTVVLEEAPSPEFLSKFGETDGRTVTVTLLDDGRVHVSCFDAVEPTHSDLAAALRQSSDRLKSDLSGLRER
jgi:hypothetical protein